MAEKAVVKPLTYSVPQVAEALGISVPKAYEVVNRADFPKIRLTKRVLVPIKEFEAWVSKEALKGSEQGEYQDDETKG
jgi:predicted DNA-binding transcriptional regulator AlpA